HVPRPPSRTVPAKSRVAISLPATPTGHARHSFQQERTMERDHDYSVFEYLYRDAGNYKTHACLLLRGRAGDEDHAAIHRALDDGTFIPERVGLPSLHEQHWRDCGSGFDDVLDHPLHEFAGVRPARL